MAFLGSTFPRLSQPTAAVGPVMAKVATADPSASSTAPWLKPNRDTTTGWRTSLAAWMRTHST
jgi:hypothetical protein